MGGSGATADTSAEMWWLNHQLFALTNDGDFVVSGGHWDNTIKITSLDSGRVVQSVSGHQDVVSCLALVPYYIPNPAVVAAIRSALPSSIAANPDAGDLVTEVLVTGSLDATVRVWYLAGGIVLPTPMHVLSGHDDAVTSVAVSPTLGLVVSGSCDGTVICYSLVKGEYIRSIAAVIPPPMPPAGSGVSVDGSVAESDRGGFATALSGDRVGWVGLSPVGVIAVYCVKESTLHTFTVNGVPLSCVETVLTRKPTFLFSEDGESLLVSVDGVIEVRDAFHLVRELNCDWWWLWRFIMILSMVVVR